LALDVNVYAMEEQPLMITVGIALLHIEETGELNYYEIILKNDGQFFKTDKLKTEKWVQEC
jgi:hypothetical protein